MVDLATAKVDIAEAARSLDRAVAAFAGALDRYGLDRGNVFELPLRSDPAPPAYVPVTPYTDAGARRAARRAIARLDYSAGQAPATTLRTPGLVAATPEIVAPVAQLNAAKDELRAAIGVIGQKQWSLVRKHMARAKTLCLLQCYHHVQVFEYGLHCVSFGWDRAGATGRRLTVARARALIQRPGHHGELPATVIEGELAALAKLPADEVLLQRKPIAPTPSCNYWTRPHTRARHRRLGLPLIVVVDPSTGRGYPEVRALDDYTADTPGKHRRSDCKTEAEAINERLHLYRYRTAYREQSAELPEAAALVPDAQGMRLVFTTAAQTTVTLVLNGGREGLADFIRAVSNEQHGDFAARAQRVRIVGYTRVDVIVEVRAANAALTQYKLPRAGVRRLGYAARIAA